MFVAANEHGRKAGECHAGGVKPMASLELHLVEHLGGAEAHLRTAIEQGEALGALGGADDPGIAPQLGRNANGFPPGARLRLHVAGPSVGEAMNLS